MATKKENIAAIQKAFGVELEEKKFGMDQLETLGLLAAKGEEGHADFDTKLLEYQPALKAPAASEAKKLERPITVRVNDAIAGYGGEFTDPDSMSTIGKKAVEVETTAFVLEKLRSGELIEER